ncbi:MAG TPA: hypothetical protein VLT61_01995 [Anaeromyxobacteraceae bacterium]|nr:hypothetical protein [Anaeromyxobacteraceae bacterium]
MSTRSVAAAQAAQTAATGVTGGPGVTVDKVRMVVRRVSVEGASCDASEDQGTSTTTTAVTTTSSTTGTSDDTGTQEGSDGCADEFNYGPYYLELTGDALKGPVAFAFSAPVPAGTYEEVEIQVNTIPSGMAGTDAGLQAMASAHASIIVDGLLDAGTSTERAFTFSTPMAVEQEREGQIVVGDAPANLTLDFDPSGWFTAPDGSRLDPNDPTNQGQILANIRASLRLVKDGDGE